MAKINKNGVGIGVVLGVTFMLIALGLFMIVEEAMSEESVEGYAGAPESVTTGGDTLNGAGVGMAVPTGKAQDVSCDFSSWVGKRASQAEAAAKKTKRPYRLLPPNSAMTMDYSAERINIDLDGRGRNAHVTKVHCG